MPKPIDSSVLAERAVSATIQDIQISATVLSSTDSHMFFGADVNATGIQPVWIEVRNQSSQPLWLLRAGTDPDYFSPLEVAWSFHSFLSGANNAVIDDHFNTLAFHNPIPPQSTRSGVIFTNPHYQIKVLNVDILGPRQLLPFTLFLPVSDDPPTSDISDIERRFTIVRSEQVEDFDTLRMVLEKIPCCAEDKAGVVAGEPLNAVAVGEFADIASALMRRGFRNSRRALDDIQLLFGRPPDFVLRKAGGSGVPANWLRIWVAPLRFRGQPVVLIQSGRPVGGRFAAADNNASALHPNVDETRNLLIQDMMYSGGLARLGFVGGVGAANVARPRPSLAGNTYYTDGLRAVMFFVTRPLDLSDVELLDWVPLPERHPADSTAELTNAQQ